VKNVVRKINDAFSNSGWTGVATRSLFSIAAMISIHWLKDLVSWTSRNILHDNFSITDMTHDRAVFIITALGTLSLIIEATYGIILLIKNKKRRRYTG
jgi:hypothetical protein